MAAPVNWRSLTPNAEQLNKWYETEGRAWPLSTSDAQALNIYFSQLLRVESQSGDVTPCNAPMIDR
jgi:hypothetical protein